MGKIPNPQDSGQDPDYQPQPRAVNAGDVTSARTGDTEKVVKLSDLPEEFQGFLRDLNKLEEKTTTFYSGNLLRILCSFFANGLPKVLERSVKPIIEQKLNEIVPQAEKYIDARVEELEGKDSELEAKLDKALAEFGLARQLNQRLAKDVKEIQDDYKRMQGEVVKYVRDAVAEFSTKLSPEQIKDIIEQLTPELVAATLSHVKEYVKTEVSKYMGRNLEGAVAGVISPVQEPELPTPYAPAVPNPSASPAPRTTATKISVPGKRPLTQAIPVAKSPASQALFYLTKPADLPSAQPQTSAPSTPASQAPTPETIEEGSELAKFIRGSSSRLKKAKEEGKGDKTGEGERQRT
jgi:hypothetical protein